TVPPRICHFEAKVLKYFFACLHLVCQITALPHAAAAALIDSEFGVNEIPVIFHEPVDAIEITALFVRCQGENEIAIRRETFLFQTNQVRNKLRRHRLVVARAAAVEEAILLQKRERIEGPVLALGLDDVKVCEQQHRLTCTSAVPTEYQVMLLRIGSKHLNVSGSKAGSFEPLRHGLSGFRDITGRGVRGVDLDELFVDVARSLFVWGDLCRRRKYHAKE